LVEGTLARPASRTLTFYTSNRGKVDEVRAALRPQGWNVVQGTRKLSEPQADDLREVALAKLEQIPRRSGAVIVEDAGLFIRSLGGFPGVFSAYARSTLGLEGILRLVRGKDRAAQFRAVIAFRCGREERLFVGVARGTIASAPRGQGGFGFDPIFIPLSSRRTFAEMSPGEKLRLSHRGKAVRQLSRYLASE
jgi:XTP/dITP diphosphohydrolase